MCAVALCSAIAKMALPRFAPAPMRSKLPAKKKLEVRLDTSHV
jgi:hypothetical protein